MAAVALAQTASEKPSTDVRRVGARVACQCGCKDSVATCSMLECSFSKPAKERIAQMQSASLSDEKIVEAFVRDYGPGIYLAPPNAFGWAVPYSLAGVGLVMILLYLKSKYRKPKPLTDLGNVGLGPGAPGTLEIEDPELARYKEQIERDMANLD